jgi:hypothetical protein
MGRQGDSKISPWPYVQSHLATLKHDDGYRRRDLAEHFVLPGLVGAGALLARLSTSGGTAAAVVGLAGIFAAFLFQLAIGVLERAAEWSESDTTPSSKATDYGILLAELSANASYASLVSGAVAIVAVAAAIAQKGWVEHLWTALLIAGGCHMAVTLLMVLQRVFLLTRARISSVQTGSHRD